LFAEVEEAATNEHRRRNELARLIFKWGFEKYKEAGSYDGFDRTKDFAAQLDLRSDGDCGVYRFVVHFVFFLGLFQWSILWKREPLT
jgi:hypothetical protein